MKIDIHKSEVYSEVDKQSSLAATMIEGGAMFDEIWVSEEGYPLLDTFWVEGCASVVQLFMRYIRNESVEHNLETYTDDEVLTIKADMPDSFNDFLTCSIISSVKMMLSYSIMAGWLGIKYPSESERYEKIAVEFSEDIKIKLLYRNAPFQNRKEHVGLDVDIETSVEKFETKSTDIDIKHSVESFETKLKDTDIESSTELFKTKSEDIDIELSTELFKTKPEDNIKFIQYEKCYNYPSQRRINE